MQTYTLNVIDRAITSDGDNTLVRTSIGVDRVLLRFDSAEWLEFTLSVFFANGSVIEEAPLSVSASSDEWACEGYCDVPSTVLEQENPLHVTVMGVDGEGDRIVTALSAPLNVVLEGSTREVIDGFSLVSYNSDDEPLVERQEDGTLKVSWQYTANSGAKGFLFETGGRPFVIRYGTSANGTGYAGTCKEGATLPDVVTKAFDSNRVQRESLTFSDTRIEFIGSGDVYGFCGMYGSAARTVSVILKVL